MKYQEIYDRLIFRCKMERRKKLKQNNPNYVYYEAHHILPECFYPEYSNFVKYPWNKVLLTGREHYIAHQLLAKIYPDNNDLFWAAHRMTSKNKNQIGRINNKLYEWLQKKASRLQSIKMAGVNNPMFGKVGELSPNFGVKRTENFRLAQSIRMTRENNNNFGNPNNYEHTEEIKQIISVRTKESLARPEIRAKLLARNRPLISEETREKKRKNRAGGVPFGYKMKEVTCPHCGKIGAINLMKRYHFNKCKNRLDNVKV